MPEDKFYLRLIQSNKLCNESGLSGASIQIVGEGKRNHKYKFEDRQILIAIHIRDLQKYINATKFPLRTQLPDSGPGLGKSCLMQVKPAHSFTDVLSFTMKLISLVHYSLCPPTLSY